MLSTLLDHYGRLYIRDDRTATPLGNEPVLSDGAIVGKTTSAAIDFRIGAPIALADVNKPAARAEGASVEVNIAGTLFSGRVTAGPVFDPGGRRMRS